MKLNLRAGDMNLTFEAYHGNSGRDLNFDTNSSSSAIRMITSSSDPTSNIARISETVEVTLSPADTNRLEHAEMAS